ncbi:hypothetical protein M8J77_018614 [Diaphorina citri]|nr:hypothetical protein M8J77_018614 [Diaphorina citri]
MHCLCCCRPNSHQALPSPSVTGDAKTTSEISPTPGSTYPPVVKGTSEGTDEDLLDLMVRIAETPSEWEKIHQVLSKLIL